MTQWPFFGPPPAILLSWRFPPNSWANSLSSAMVAKQRLRAVTRADREACNDGKLVPKRRETNFWDLLIAGGEVYLRGRRLRDIAEIKRYFKPRYRWGRRR
ncbi:TPA: hypothetical protein ACXJLS_000379 [Stenotrophomonas maltophilia]